MKPIKRINKNIFLLDMMYAQDQLDEIVFDNANIDRESTKTQRTVALVGEIVEVADELPKWWKYWKQNTPPLNWGNVVEELADVLHFILSKGIDVGAKYEHDEIILYNTEQEQLRGLLQWAALCDGSVDNWEYCMGVYRGLLQKLEIDWKKMRVAYFAKNEINIKRQENGY